MYIMKLFVTFIIFSFVGYLGEVLLCSLLAKKWVNRGFLFGPLCPIYGCGGILDVLALSGYKDNPVLIFILGTLICGIVEYYTSYIFEKLFNNRWWDYSDRKDSINGRVSLTFLLLFGVGSLVAIYIAYPLVNYMFGYLNDTIILIIGIILAVLFIADIIGSAIIAYNLRSKLIIAEELKHEKIKLLPSLLEKKYKDQIVKIKFRTNRLLKNYPQLSKGLTKELNFIGKMLDKYKSKKRQ